MTNYTWRGTNSGVRSGDWETTADWIPHGEPGAADVATIGFGPVMEDVDQPLLNSQNQINYGVEIGALTIGASGALVIGDSAGNNRAIMTIENTQTSVVAGSITVYAAGTEQSQLLVGGAFRLASGGTVNLDGGTLIAENSLTLTGPGAVELLGGYIGGSSSQPTDTLLNYSTISGMGALSAANYYAAPPATPLSGPLNFNGLVTYNYGVIDGTDTTGGVNGLVIEGGVVRNFGTIEATNASGQSGSGGLYIDAGAEIVNLKSGAMTSGGGSFLDLDGGAIYNGSISGLFYVDGTGNVLGTTQGGSLTLDATTYIGNAGTTLTVATSGVINDGALTVEAGATMRTSNFFSNNINGAIDVYGLFATGTLGDIGNTGHINADSGGTAIFNTHYLTGGGTVDINGGVAEFTATGAAHVDFESGGTLAFNSGGSVASVTNFYDEGSSLSGEQGKINFADVSWASNPSASLTQEGGYALLSVAGYTVDLQGTYTTATGPVALGIAGLTLIEGPHGSTSVTG